MPNVTDHRARRVFETMQASDPVFHDLVGVLYGPGVDLETVFEDVISKRGVTPDEKRQQMEARVGLASNYVGLAAGTAGTIAASRNPALKRKGATADNAGPAMGRVAHWAKSPKGKGRIIQAGAAGALGLQVANVGGDVVANRVLGRSAKGKVEKADAGLARMVSGRIASMMSLTPKPVSPQASLGPMFGRPAPPKGPGMLKRTGGALGRAAGDPKAAASSALATATASPKNVAITGGALMGTGALASRRKGGGQSYGAPQPTMYGKRDDTPPDVTWAGEFSKFDEDKRVAFGWASVVKKDGLPVVDRQGDYMSAEDVEKAAYEYVMKSRKGGDMHARVMSELGEDQPKHVADLIESVVFTDEKIAKMGLPDDYPRGWWIGMKVHDDETWQLVKNGERTGFSIHGKGKRQDMPIDAVMGYSA